MPRKRNIHNDSDIPTSVLEALVRRLLPDIIAYYDSDEGQREFNEWKRKQKNSKYKP